MANKNRKQFKVGDKVIVKNTDKNDIGAKYHMLKDGIIGVIVKEYDEEKSFKTWCVRPHKDNRLSPFTQIIMEEDLKRA